MTVKEIYSYHSKSSENRFRQFKHNLIADSNLHWFPFAHSAYFILNGLIY